MNKKKAENYTKMSRSEKISYNLNGINRQLKKLDADFKEFTKPEVELIKEYLRENKMLSGCTQGYDFCIDCGLNEIELNLYIN